jgi:hypothetical protein
MFGDLDRIARSTRLLALILSIAALSGCGGGGGGGAPGANNPPPPPPPSGGTQFTKMLILGGSTAAGYQSSGISATTQRQTYGALLAEHDAAAVSYDCCLISARARLRGAAFDPRKRFWQRSQ